MPCCRKIDTFRTILEINVLGVHAVSQAFLPLLKMGHKKTVINMSSCLGSHAFLVEPASFCLHTRPVQQSAFPQSEHLCNMLIGIVSKIPSYLMFSRHMCTGVIEISLH